MRDEEWTALAVWATNNGITAYGNNAELNIASNYAAPRDIDDPDITFVDDPAYAWSASGKDRALTGSATSSNWAGRTNLTTHSGTTSGVFDLNGNVWEWVETVGSGSGLWHVNLSNDRSLSSTNVGFRPALRY